MVHFERTLTIKLETAAEVALYVEALELAADNAPKAGPLWVQLKTRVAVLNTWRPGWKPSETAPARVTLSFDGAQQLATALEVIEEINGEARAEHAGALDRSPDWAALNLRCNMLENAARYIREAIRS